MAYPARHLIRMAAPPVLGALVAGAIVAPASAAWTTDCLWNGIPAADRAAAIAAQDSKSLRIARSEIKAAAEACGVTKTDAADAQKAFAAYGLGLATMATLESRYGVTQAQVLTAWAALSNADRASFVGIAGSMRNEPQKIAILEGVASQMAQRLNLGADAAPQLRRVVYSLALLQSIGRGGFGE